MREGIFSTVAAALSAVSFGVVADVHVPDVAHDLRDDGVREGPPRLSEFGGSGPYQNIRVEEPVPNRLPGRILKTAPFTVKEEEFIEVLRVRQRRRVAGSTANRLDSPHRFISPESGPTMADDTTQLAIASRRTEHKA